ncbi:hypothetical protein [Hymenobacter koreensis]|uniref:Uncharacterized protein n=1 Tax=Hymenobacter koreensis TaxID=1084523 RepID=A0ABP8JK92_9BACT
MRFLERNLEDILYKELEHCRDRGFDIEPMENKVCRQLNLAPFGIADLVHFGYQPDQERIHVRIIECKKDVVNTATYLQASRYQTAISRVLDCCTFNPIFEKVLVGQKVDPKNDFWYLVDADMDARIYTYDYRHDGIVFKRHRPHDAIGKSAQHIHRSTVGDIFAWAAQYEEENE